MRKLGIFFLVVLLVIFSLGGFVVYQLYQHPKYIRGDQTPARGSIVFLGDSHVHGRIGVDFVAEMQREFGQYEMLNYGHNGDSAKDALAKIDQIKKTTPVQIYLLVGTNDVLDSLDGKNNLDEFAKSYRKLVTELKNIAPLFLISIPMMGDRESGEVNVMVKKFNQTIATISGEEAVKYLPFFNKMAAYHDSHPGDKKDYDNHHFSRGLLVGFRHYLLGQDLAQIAKLYQYALTVDGLHLNGPGSELLISMLAPEIPAN